MAVSFTKINDFVEDIGNGAHNLSSDQLAVALSNTAPSAETNDPTADGNGVLANITQISYTNLSSRNLTTTSWALSSGTAKLTLEDLTLTASGGSVGPLRYIYLYNDDATNDELIGVYDYGSSITLEDGDQLVLDFDDSNGVLTLA